MWNVAQKNFIKLKNAFSQRYGEENLWNYETDKNCIEHWISYCEDFVEMFTPLIITEHNDLVMLRYNLLESNAQFWEAYDQMYRECRSVVLNKKTNELVLVPFRKFFNMNETEETQERLIRERIAVAKSIEFSDKLDGSMQSARYYNGNVVLAGTRALDPNVSFRLEIGYELMDDNYKKMLKDYPDFTFVFELICKEDQHVVVYGEEDRGLYLIGIRDVNTGFEFPYKDVIAMANKYHIKHTAILDKTLDEILSELDAKKSYEAEGFVINIDGYKVKLKYNDYVTIHHAIAKFISPNFIIKCVENGTWDDIKAKIPAAYRVDADIIADDVISFVKKMNNQINRIYKECLSKYNRGESTSDDMKNFATYVMLNHKDIAHYLLSLKRGKNNNFIKNTAGRYLRYHEIKEKLMHL